MATKLLLSVLLCMLISIAVGRQQKLSQTRLTQGQQCQFNRIRTSQPSQRIESEGGITELWDENEDQFQCAGVAPIRQILQPQSLSLPSFQSSPRLVYIERGTGFVGFNFPGCAETFHGGQQQGSGSWERQEKEEEEEEEQGGRGERGVRMSRDQHHKVHRIRQGDIIAVPAGVAHWCYNDGNEELVAVSINDLNHEANQLDQSFRSFQLAGGVSREQQQGVRGRGRQGSQMNFQNIFRAFDENLLAQAYQVPSEIIRRLQKDQNRGVIVRAREGMRFIRPEERREAERMQERDGQNGIEETICSMKMIHDLERRGEVEVFARQVGRLSVVNRNKLPILSQMDMSAERGHLHPNAIFTPHWSCSGHTIVYVTRGDAHVQIVDDNGNNVFDERVNEKDMFVIPQFYVSSARAGRNGFHYTAIKTTSQPFKHPLAGYTSVINAMPIQVLANAFQMSPKEARNLKQTRHGQTLLMSPQRSSS